LGTQRETPAVQQAAEAGGRGASVAGGFSLSRIGAGPVRPQLSGPPLGGPKRRAVNPPPPFPPLAFPFVFVGFWVVISFVLSSLGGWRALAAVYRREGPPQPDRSWFSSGRFTWVRYRGCLVLGAGVLGLDIAVQFPFMLGHPPLRIPWSEISARVEEGWFRELRLTFRQVPGVRVRLPAHCIEWLPVASAGHLRIEGAA
jgi:hypothetical protein